jgi:hypothetical protein
MAGFTFRLEREDGTPAEPPTFHAAVPNWQAGGSLPLGDGGSLRVIGVRHECDESVLVVALGEPHPGRP